MINYDKDKTVFEKLSTLMSNIRVENKNDFYGVGLIITDHINGLPVYQLPIAKKYNIGKFKTEAMLKWMCGSKDALHDGFHILTSNMDILLNSCYVAAPIPECTDKILNSDLDIEKIGSRWITALFTSLIPEVHATGIISASGSQYLFVNGVVYKGVD
ncbi:hypothetical protein [Vreelandella neptunia]|uniref:Uncharacterized protein n=1 Tax=Vreelandella neptunia TaxID=115551 RepID=A0ABS9SBJ1_9GAMM|nr:hypothetical protein [Halomonas neptunia]MCH4813333.1 hypothetical protein [Halomonas neptunia]